MAVCRRKGCMADFTVKKALEGNTSPFPKKAAAMKRCPPLEKIEVLPPAAMQPDRISAGQIRNIK